MAAQPPTQDTPFGLEPNAAAGLAYLVPIFGGIVMLAAGGTNRFVKWAAAQSLVLWGLYVVAHIVLGVLYAPLFFTLPILLLIHFALGLLGLIVWLWTFITAFQGRELQIPFVADLTRNIFKTTLG